MVPRSEEDLWTASREYGVEWLTLNDPLEFDSGSKIKTAQDLRLRAIHHVNEAEDLNLARFGLEQYFPLARDQLAQDLGWQRYLRGFGRLFSPGHLRRGQSAATGVRDLVWRARAGATAYLESGPTGTCIVGGRGG